ncbi:hypothetical protein EYZ11_003371 [Aspergillus tanneri]|uniref:Uncharacterized protein n=1 Tax=Aspergillus tanneri TaxID=1220188 RepID=A0A4S3JNE3_9EURO|nr:hypothetical protein EYZ11_003371 [Aspergillus tanneri]
MSRDFPPSLDIFDLLFTANL